MEDFRAKMDREFSEMAAEDKAAKDASTLIGRYVRESIADGYAYYRVVGIKGLIAVVDHIHICDGYRVPMIESMGGEIPLKYARENIQMRDKWDELFAK